MARPRAGQSSDGTAAIKAELRKIDARLKEIERNQKKIAEAQDRFTRKRSSHCWVCGCAGAGTGQLTAVAVARPFAALGAG